MLFLINESMQQDFVLCIIDQFSVVVAHLYLLKPAQTGSFALSSYRVSRGDTTEARPCGQKWLIVTSIRYRAKLERILSWQFFVDGLYVVNAGVPAIGGPISPEYGRPHLLPLVN